MTGRYLFDRGPNFKKSASKLKWKNIIEAFWRSCWIIIIIIIKPPSNYLLSSWNQRVRILAYDRSVTVRHYKKKKVTNTSMYILVSALSAGKRSTKTAKWKLRAGYRDSNEWQFLPCMFLGMCPCSPYDRESPRDSVSNLGSMTALPAWDRDSAPHGGTPGRQRQAFAQTPPERLSRATSTVLFLTL